MYTNSRERWEGEGQESNEGGRGQKERVKKEVYGQKLSACKVENITAISNLTTQAKH